MGNAEVVRDILGERELLAQLAEECNELAKAALKLRRALGGKNWTPKTVEECRAELIEEHADVCGVFKALDWNDKEQRKIIMDQKMSRWRSRLEEHNPMPTDQQIMDEYGLD